MEDADHSELHAMVAEIVSGYLSKNRVAATDLPELIATVHRSLQGLGKAREPERLPVPAVPVRQSIAPDYVVCLECGNRRKTLRRHIRMKHGLTVAAYRDKWRLPADHPIVAPAYSGERSRFAKQLGLGSRPGKPGGRQTARTEQTAS